MAAASLGFVAYAIVFFVLNFTDSFLELGIGHDEVPVSREEVKAISPELYHYILHLQVAISGFIAATGVAAASLAWYGVRRGLWWAFVTAIAAPVLALAVALPAHYPYHFATLGHLGPIYIATGVFVIGASVALKPMLTARGQTPSR
jgi:hypothetical protein